MNPLLFMNLSTQRRLLESGTAYGAARVAVNVAFSLFGIVGIVGAFVWVSMFGRLLVASGGALPDGAVFLNWVMLAGGGLAYAAGVYAAWAAARAFFDIADACLAISLKGSEEHSLPSESVRSPRQGGDNWPEPPEPLIPIPGTAKPEDARYLPKG